MLWPTAAACFICRMMELFTWSYIITGIITIIFFINYYYHQLSPKVAKEVLCTFRAIVSIVSLSLIIICDVARVMINFSYFDMMFHTSIIDVIIYASLCGGFILVDACENMTRWTRFAGPSCLMAVSIQNLILCETEAYGWDDNVVKFTIIMVLFAHNHDLHTNDPDIHTSRSSNQRQNH